MSYILTDQREKEERLKGGISLGCKELKSLLKSSSCVTSGTVLSTHSLSAHSLFHSFFFLAHSKHSINVSCINSPL